MEIRWIMPFLWGLKTSVCFDKDVRSFSIKRAFVWMETCVRLDGNVRSFGWKRAFVFCFSEVLARARIIYGVRF